jgi:APA family basic amino acid/polyamine antiporter
MLSFTIAHIAVIRLRIKYPERKRPYRGPGNVTVRGFSIPLFAVFGGLGTGLAFVGVTTLYVPVAITGVGWLALGVVVYVAYRRGQGLDLVSTLKVQLPVPAVDHDVEYASVLVAFEHDRFDREALATAARLAARRKRAIYVLVLIEVPSSATIGAWFPAQEDAANTIIEQAKLFVRGRVTGRWVKVRAGQAGRTIVDEARHAKVEAIVLPLEQTGPTNRFNKTLQTVLAERPCRVILAYDPLAAERATNRGAGPPGVPATAT